MKAPMTETDRRIFELYQPVARWKVVVLALWPVMAVIWTWFLLRILANLDFSSL